MSLNAFVAEKKRSVFDALMEGQTPSEGSYDESVFREARAKGRPQMGSTRYLPQEIILEFIYSDTKGSTVIFPVTLPSPERIVFLPVPSWVVESIWQGDIDGSFQFESDAMRLLGEFTAKLDPKANAALFGPQMAKRRE